MVSTPRVLLRSPYICDHAAPHHVAQEFRRLIHRHRGYPTVTSEAWNQARATYPWKYRDCVVCPSLYVLLRSRRLKTSTWFS